MEEVSADFVDLTDEVAGDLVVDSVVFVGETVEELAGVVLVNDAVETVDFSVDDFVSVSFVLLSFVLVSLVLVSSVLVS